MGFGEKETFARIFALTIVWRCGAMGQKIDQYHFGSI